MMIYFEPEWHEFGEAEEFDALGKLKTWSTKQTIKPDLIAFLVRCSMSWPVLR